MEQDQVELYSRTLKDAKAIIEHAKLDEKNLTEITQSIYYPSENINGNNFKLLELNNDILSQIKEGQTIQFKGSLNEKVVLCTDEKTYEVKEAEISNSLFVIPTFKFGQQTSTSPLKSPKLGTNTSFENNLNDSGEEQPAKERVLERRDVIKVFNEYLECRETKAKYHKLFDLLQMTRYSGPENEYCTDKKLLFRYENLLNAIQCSRKEFDEGLRRIRAIEIDGHMRILEYEYEFRIINIMLGLINENSWNLQEIDRQITIESFEGIAPKKIVQSLFDIYTKPSELNMGKFQYDEKMISKIIAQNILQPGLKFRIEDFLTTWQDALPEGMTAKESYLRGIGIIDRESSSKCVRALAEENLPTNLLDRIKILFQTKQKWTLDQIEPYIEYFSTPASNGSVTAILSKYARAMTIDGTRYYVTKHT